MNKPRNSMRGIIFLISTLALASCGNGSNKEEQAAIPMYTEANAVNGISGSGGTGGSNASVDEQEGPQYQQPTMDVLKGKNQLFPAKYPVKRYPHATVAMVDVRPGRPPGYKNMVLLKTADQMPQISTFYKQNLALDNWKLVGAYSNECYESTRWVKGDLECEVRIAPDLRTGDKKYVQLMTGLRMNKPPMGGKS